MKLEYEDIYVLILKIYKTLKLLKFIKKIIYDNYIVLNNLNVFYFYDDYETTIIKIKI